MPPRNVVDNAIESISDAGGATSISVGMQRGLSLLEAGTARRVMLVLSDGEQVHLVPIRSLCVR